MSGGFFRGTTADQDTRFSNKQAKLMKSQKFAPELEHLVDMSKVKMDVVRPWIAKRVTELLGFEDEVLINFIYGLLDGKNVNGKEIQISITGFMEKNTGKFMKELWTLLLSAQNNASGVPQQFLDEKEEETKKKKADAERITNEIQRKKEREAEESGLTQTKMEGGLDTSRNNATSDKPFANDRNGRESSESPDERNVIAGRNGRDRKSRQSYSRSPKARKRSISMERERPNQRRSISPLYHRSSRRSPSPSRRRLSYRRRSRSHSRSRSLSPQRFESSPHARRRRRSPSPVRRRSPSPLRRRSPPRRTHRSPSPVRRRSPFRRSPSPVRRRSPLRRSPSPVRRRSPLRRSPSPVRRRSPLRRSPSPVRRRSPIRRSRTPAARGSRALAKRLSHSPVQDRSPLVPPRRGSTSSPSQGASPSPKHNSLSPQKRRSPSPPRHRLSSARRRRTPSPVTHGSHIQKSPSAYKYRHRSPDSSKLPSPSGGKITPDLSASESPKRQQSTLPSREKSSAHLKNPILPSSIKNHSSPNKRLERKSYMETNFSRKDESNNFKGAPSKDENYLLSSESPPSRAKHPYEELRALDSLSRKESNIIKESPTQVTNEVYSAQGDRERRDTFAEGGSNAKDIDHEKNKMDEGGHHLKHVNASHKTTRKGASSDSGYDDDKKRKHKSSSKRHEETSDDNSSDTETDESKDAKRRKRKEEKRLRREKRRQRHEEKRRRKEERRSEKYMSRKDDDSSIKNKFQDNSDAEEDDEENKKQLEIELRKKALESLKAKKGFGQ